VTAYMKREERVAMVLNAIESGASTLQEVADAAGGITRERVRQLLNRLEPEERDHWLELMLQNRSRGMLTVLGEKKRVVDWAADPRCLISYDLLCSRLHNGWDAEEALRTPTLGRGGTRMSLRGPDRLPEDVAERLVALCRAATRVRGWTAADDPGRAAALRRDALVRELNDQGYTAAVIADAVGYSVYSVEMWMRYTAGTRERYGRMRAEVRG